MILRFGIYFILYITNQICYEILFKKQKMNKNLLQSCTIQVLHAKIYKLNYLIYLPKTMSFVKPFPNSDSKDSQNVDTEPHFGNLVKIKGETRWQSPKGSSMVISKNIEQYQKYQLSKTQIEINHEIQKQYKNKPLNYKNKTKKTLLIQNKEIQNETSFHHFFSQISIHKEFQWKTDMAFIRNNQIQLPMKTINIHHVTKLKILEDESLQNFRKIKMTMDYEETYFGLECRPVRKQSLQASLHYKWFAKLINLKLETLGQSLDSKKQNTQKVQIRGASNKSQYFISGIIYKKSQFFGRWEQRYVRINETGLYSYRPVQKSNSKHQDNTTYSFCLKSSSVKYIWTRFQIFNNSLIIKVKHGLQQTQFAIPVMNFSETSHGDTKNWLYAFYRLMMDKHLILHSGSKLSKQTNASLQKQSDIRA